MLSIVICIKQVPDTQTAVFDASTGVIDRSSTDNIMNPDDHHALEMALTIKDIYGAKITAITMGPLQAEDVLCEAYALGADDCVLITDPRFAGSDSLVTSMALSRCIQKLGPFDIVVTGFEAIDGNTAHVAFQLSEFLGVPLVTQIHKFQIHNNAAIIERLYGHEYQTIRVELPLLVAIGKHTNRVRIPRLADINICHEKKITVMTMDDLGGNDGEYGAAGSPTVVIDTKIFTHKREREVLSGSLNHTVDQLVHRLKKHNILRY